jgi:hypothetical protein
MPGSDHVDHHRPSGPRPGRTRPNSRHSS